MEENVPLPKCPYCNNEQISKWGIDEKDRNLYECDNCNSNFIVSINNETIKLSKDTRNIKGFGKTVRCPYCNVETWETWGIDEQGRALYECTICKSNFTLNDDGIIEKLSVHPELKNTIKRAKTIDERNRRLNKQMHEARAKEKKRKEKIERQNRKLQSNDSDVKAINVVKIVCAVMLALVVLYAFIGNDGTIKSATCPICGKSTAQKELDWNGMCDRCNSIREQAQQYKDAASN